MVDLANVDELKGVRVTADGVEIGAMTTLTEVATHPELLANYSVLTDAAAQIATPQIRNRGTIAGNLAAGHALLVLPRWMALLPGRR